MACRTAQRAGSQLGTAAARPRLTRDCRPASVPVDRCNRRSHAAGAARRLVLDCPCVTGARTDARGSALERRIDLDLLDALAPTGGGPVARHRHPSARRRSLLQPSDPPSPSACASARRRADHPRRTRGRRGRRAWRVSGRSEADAELVTLIHQRTGGVPLFAEHLLDDWLARDGSASSPALSWRPSHSPSSPTPSPTAYACSSSTPPTVFPLQTERCWAPRRSPGDRSRRQECRRPSTNRMRTSKRSSPTWLGEACSFTPRENVLGRTARSRPRSPSITTSTATSSTGESASPRPPATTCASARAWRPATSRSWRRSPRASPCTSPGAATSTRAVRYRLMAADDQLQRSAHRSHRPPPRRCRAAHTTARRPHPPRGGGSRAGGARQRIADRQGLPRDRRRLQAGAPAVRSAGRWHPCSARPVRPVERIARRGPATPPWRSPKRSMTSPSTPGTPASLSPAEPSPGPAVPR